MCRSSPELLDDLVVLVESVHDVFEGIWDIVLGHIGPDKALEDLHRILAHGEGATNVDHSALEQ